MKRKEKSSSLAELAERLRRSRLEKGLTQEEVGKLLGVSRLAVWGMEQGKRAVDAWELYNLARVYGKSVEDFFREKVTESDLVLSFQEYGYPVYSTQPAGRGRLLDPTTLFLYVLAEAPDPRLVEGLPVVVFTQSLNYEWLYREALRLGVQNRLGLVLDLTLQAFQRLGAAKDTRLLEALLSRLERVKLGRVEAFEGRAPSPNEEERLQRLSDPLSRKWNLLSNFPLDSIVQGLHRAKKESLFHSV